MRVVAAVPPDHLDDRRSVVEQSPILATSPAYVEHAQDLDVLP
jgi:hypothetical protein